MLHPADWSQQDRDEVLAFHLVFEESNEGREVLRVLRRELYDRPSATARDGGARVMLDDRATVFNEGKRAAVHWILGQLEAYRTMTTSEPPQRRGTE